MENYIVSARKYRPSTFESVVGQKALTTTLKNAIATHKLAHAYLFCGPRGVGKTTCARIFAKTINCMSPTADGEACNQCESCVAFNEQRSYNIHELDAASNNSVDDIRQLVEQVRIPPQIGNYKVYIIDEVHMLSASAFNAFLKTLEEPPKHAIFILATTEKHKILPTILSRCQIYDFNRIGVEDTVNHLMYVAQKENVSAEPEALNVIALKADGGMRDALSIFDQVVSFTGGNITYQGAIENLNVLDYDYYFRLTDYFLEGNVSSALLLFNDVLNNGFDGGHFITGLSSHFRDLLVSKDGVTVSLLEVGASIRDKYQAQAQKCPVKFLYKALKLCNDCDLNYRISKNKRLLVELTLILVAQIVSEGDEASHGLGPTQIKPIAKNQAATTQQSAQPVQSAAPVTSAQTTAAQPTTTTQPQAQTPAAPREMPDILKQSQGTAEKKIPVRKKEGISIRNFNNEKEQSTASTQQTIANVEPEKDHPFDESDLRYQWQLFAQQLPLEHRAMAGRMQGMNIKLLDATTFEAVVENDFVVDQFMPLKPAIEMHLRTQLHNKQIKMIFRVSAPEEKRRPTSKAEKYQAMAEKNQALITLKNEFGLEFY
ncbi:DNA polymerase III subunit gamma/tau [Bacteroides sp. 519]|uniref:DNA polymerase III subunit gamma/tau n=1 Tax=Bacteroides sp. 519 TaxID=2302937 RepID=UPI0013D817C8|nr:DNA polymerase III subunit gamma/tau [Bacteroides sp. 519]NDV59994.1 DNA polymerase III subunit gamma/tau [Bacteroides sp. 519]